MGTDIRIEVFRNKSGIVTVIAEGVHGNGVRLCGVKLPGSGSSKVCEFSLGRDAIAALAELADDEREFGGQSNGR